ncbi:hypothetical protein K439DRAFT_1616948 [Ramaria rubella]|nr:hypothetical protein K439DRAFT_1616948 [Ramaria rubella]
MNAQALKNHIQGKLRDQRFELTCIEHSYWHSVSGGSLAMFCSVAPEPLELKGLFDIDVDDSIWFDSGLGDDGDEVVPHWLSDNAVRSGIVALLQVDRCKEEKSRVKRECSQMQRWFSTEWDAVKQAHNEAEGSIEGLLTDSSPLSDWGPTPMELEVARNSGTSWKSCDGLAGDHVQRSDDGELVSSDDDEEITLEDEMEEDEYILEVLEGLAVSDM